MIVSCWVQSIAYLATSILVFTYVDDLPALRFVKIILGSIISLILCALISNLIILHVYLQMRGITTYEYILETR